MDKAISNFPVIEEYLEEVCLAENDEIGVVISQPRLDLDKDSEPPFRITENSRAETQWYVRQAIALAHDLKCKSRIIILPEYSVSWTDPNSVAVLAGWINEAAPENTVVIAGLEPIAVTDFNSLVASLPGLSCRIDPSAGGPGSFLNCALTLSKNNTGGCRSYLQAKLRPSVPEADTQRMLNGDHVYLFRTRWFNFLILICFDVISSEANRSLVDEVIKSIGELGGGNSINVDAVIAIQHNDEPFHPEFLSASAKFLRARRDINTNDAVAIHANTASNRACVHGAYGHTSLLFRAETWKPALEPAFLWSPAPAALRKVIQVFEFRRRDAGVLSFIYRRPNTNRMAAGDPRTPCAQGRFWGLDAIENKWDSKDTTALPLKLADFICSEEGIDAKGKEPCYEDYGHLFECAGRDLGDELKRVRQRVTPTLFALNKHRLRDIFKLLFCASDEKLWQDCDQWNLGPGGGAVRELARSVCILSLLEPLTMDCVPLATADSGSTFFAILDGGGTQSIRQAWSSYERYSDQFPRSKSRNITIVANRFHGAPTQQDRRPSLINQPREDRFGGSDFTQAREPREWLVSNYELERALDFDSLSQSVEYLRTVIE